MHVSVVLHKATILNTLESKMKNYKVHIGTVCPRIAILHIMRNVRLSYWCPASTLFTKFWIHMEVGDNTTYMNRFSGLSASNIVSIGTVVIKYWLKMQATLMYALSDSKCRGSTLFHKGCWVYMEVARYKTYMSIKLHSIFVLSTSCTAKNCEYV